MLKPEPTVQASNLAGRHSCDGSGSCFAAFIASAWSHGVSAAIENGWAESWSLKMDRRSCTGTGISSL
jgi:hypothetical protein